MHNEKYICSKSPKFYPLNAETRTSTSVTLKEIYDYPRRDVVPLDDLVGRRYKILSKIAINHVSFIDRAGKVDAIVNL